MSCVLTSGRRAEIQLGLTQVLSLGEKYCSVPCGDDKQGGRKRWPINPMVVCERAEEREVSVRWDLMLFRNLVQVYNKTFGNTGTCCYNNLLFVTNVHIREMGRCKNSHILGMCYFTVLHCHD